MLAIQDIEQKLAILKDDLSKEKIKNKKVAIEKEIKTLTNNLANISAYEQIKIGDFVVNGNPSKIGTVSSKQIQNALPVVWIDWDGIKISSVPKCLKVIPSEQLQWQWIKNNFARVYDDKNCDDLSILLAEKQRLETELKILQSSFGVFHSSNPIQDILEIKIKIEKIIELWEDAIAFQFPLDSGFFLHNRKVTVKSYQLSKQHNLVFPVVFDGQTKHLGHPLELRKIPLGQINLFPEDNSDPNEPDETKSEFKSQNSELARPLLKSIEPTVKKYLENTSDLRRMTSDFLKIDPEFQSLIPPLQPDQRKQLEENLIKEGCRDALIIWQSHNILIDGHNRYEICLKHNIKYNTAEIELADRDSVINWMISNQLGRRNLKPDVAAYLRGKLYHNLKKQQGGDRNKQGTNQHIKELTNDSSSKCQNDTLSLTKKSTAEQVAKKTGVSKRNVYRDAKYSEAVEAIALKVDCSPQDIINSPLSKKQVKEMVNLPVESIKQKLENPTFIDRREFPELKVGDVVKIKSDRKNKDFVGYNGTIAIVDAVYDNSCDIRIWQKLLTNIHKQFLSKIDGDTVTLNITVTPHHLIQLMQTFDSIEDAIIPF